MGRGENVLLFLKVSSLNISPTVRETGTPARLRIECLF